MKETMMAAKLSDLYEKDETAWLEKSVDLIKEKHYDELDYTNLEEFLDSMAKSQRREVKSRLRSLLTHLLKWQLQPKQRCKSWRLSILHQREELQDIFTMKTLKNHAHDVLADAYKQAVGRASDETDLPLSVFPPECPYSFDFLVSDELPESSSRE